MRSVVRLPKYIVRRFRRVLHHALPPFRYVAIGDSTVEGVGASNPARAYAGLVHAAVKAIFIDTAYQNLGKRGARVRDVLDTQLEATIAAQPGLITISVGANDVVRGTRLAAFERSFRTLVTRLRQETDAMIVITNIPNFSTLPAVPQPLRTVTRLRIQRFNASILRVARECKVIHIDAYRQSTLFTKLLPETVYTDGFHPSDLGYALWATTLMNTIHDQLASLALERAAHPAH